MNKNGKIGVLLLIWMLCMSGCGNTSVITPAGLTENTLKTAEKAKNDIIVYFSDHNAEKLIATVIEQTKEIAEDPLMNARTVIESLIVGPEKGSGLYAVMPKGTKINGIGIDLNGTLTVDLSHEFIDNQVMGSTAMALTVYALVNSLTMIDGIENVVIFIDGNPVEAYEGLIMPKEPISPDFSFTETNG